MKWRDISGPALTAIALVIIGAVVRATLQAQDLADAARCLGYALMGCGALILVILAWPPADPFDVGDLPELGDTHQHLIDPIDLGYLGETEAACTCGALPPVSFEKAGGAGRTVMIGAPTEPIQIVGESAAEYRARCIRWASAQPSGYMPALW